MCVRERQRDRDRETERKRDRETERDGKKGRSRAQAVLDELWSVMKEGDAADVGAVNYGLQRTFVRSMVKSCKPQSTTVRTKEAWHR